MHLLDTDVVWELRGAKAGRANPEVTAWAAKQAGTRLFVSALTLAELAAGAAQVERTDKAAAAAIRRWLEVQVSAAFDGRVLPVDAAVARRAGALDYAELRDGLLAATTLEHGLTLATPRPAAFRGGKVRTCNPWRHQPGAVEDDGDWRQATRGGPSWLRNLFVRG